MPVEVCSAIYMTNTSQNCQGHQKNKGKSEKLSQPRRAKGDMTANVIWCPSWDLETEKRYQVKTKEI